MTYRVMHDVGHLGRVYKWPYYRSRDTMNAGRAWRVALNSHINSRLFANRPTSRTGVLKEESPCRPWVTLIRLRNTALLLHWP